MPISSFYGMQTSLRGLIAQQRMLDTTGHNIANASTIGYTRQEAMLSASHALQVQVAGSATATGAHLGAGVDVQGFRRVRDQFLDAQYRAQNTSLNDWSAKAQALDSAELSLAEPGETGINAQLTKFWQSWSNLSKDPDDPAVKQALVQQAGALTDSIHSVRSQMVAAQDAAMGEYESIAGPGGEVEKISKELAGLNKVISASVTNGDSPNDLMDRRDVLLDQLSAYGQISVVQLASGSTDVSFVDASGTAYPIVADKTALWTGAPTPWSPGGQMGGLLEAGKQPDGLIADYLTKIDAFSDTLASKVNAAYGGVFLANAPGPGSGSTIAVTQSIRDNPTTIVAGSGSTGSNDIANAVSKLRDDPVVAGGYKALVAKVGGDLNEAIRMQSNAQILTNSVEDRRQSVAGVSMDEEMSNLVRFQRAYQASARAMSTMDEMLDVLINRTGRVGL